MKKVLKWMSALLLSFSLCSPYALAAKSMSELKKGMAERNSEMQKLEKQIDQKKDEKDTQVAQREKLDVQIASVLGDIDDVEDVISQKDQEISQKNDQIEELNVQIAENTETLKTRLKVMYEYGDSSYMALLLESKGLSDLFTRLSAVKSILSHDQNLIDRFEADRQAVEDAKAVIENEKQEQVEAKDMLVSKKNELKKLQSEKDTLIASINQDIKALEQEEKDAESDYNSMKAELDKALAEEKARQAREAAAKKSQSSAASVQTYKGNGQLQWPSAASTTITSQYGYRIHPISKTKRLHRGIDISAAAGTNVLAAEGGTVITAGWNNSYGYYVTISHGSGLVTLYAHNSKLLVSRGQTVTKGQTIAKVGSTGNSTGPHIHFEVMVNGALQNPMNYL